MELKIELHFKTPDVVDEAVDDIQIDSDGREEYEIEDIRLSLKSKIKRHIEYGEYLTVYYDTDTDKLTLR